MIPEKEIRLFRIWLVKKYTSLAHLDWETIIELWEEWKKGRDGK